MGRMTDKLSTGHGKILKSAQERRGRLSIGHTTQRRQTTQPTLSSRLYQIAWNQSIHNFSRSVLTANETSSHRRLRPPLQFRRKSMHMVFFLRSMALGTYRSQSSPRRILMTVLHSEEQKTATRSNVRGTWRSDERSQAQQSCGSSSIASRWKKQTWFTSIIWNIRMRYRSIEHSLAVWGGRDASMRRWRFR